MSIFRAAPIAKWQQAAGLPKNAFTSNGITALGLLPFHQKCGRAASLQAAGSSFWVAMSTQEERCSSSKVVLAQAPLTFDPGRVAGPADPALSRPSHHRRYRTSEDGRLSGLCCAVRPRAQPVRPHARRPTLARSSSDVARSRPTLPVPEPGLQREATCHATRQESLACHETRKVAERHGPPLTSRPEIGGF